MTKKVVSLNGSPNCDKGNTGKLLNCFLKGLEENNCTVEKFNVYKLDINPCMAEFACWIKNEGDCFQDDDMTPVTEAVINSDIFILATPLYVDGMSGPLKTAVDRLLCQIMPFVEIVDGRMRHPARYPDKPKQLVLVSTCAFWKLENFDPLVQHVKAICKNFRVEYGGAVLRPHAGYIEYMRMQNEPVDFIYDAVYEAGKQFAVDGVMSEEILKSVSQVLIDKESYTDGFNKMWHQMFERMKKK